MYEIGLFNDDFEYHLSPDDDTFVKADLSDVPAMKMNHKETALAAKAYWDMGVPARIAFDTVGATIEEYEGMDISYISNSIRDSSLPPPAPVSPFGAPNPADPNKPAAKPDGVVNAGDVEGADAGNAANGQKPAKKKAMRLPQRLR